MTSSDDVPVAGDLWRKRFACRYEMPHAAVVEAFRDTLREHLVVERRYAEEKRRALLLHYARDLLRLGPRRVQNYASAQPQARKQTVRERVGEEQARCGKQAVLRPWWSKFCRRAPHASTARCACTTAFGRPVVPEE